MKINTSMPYMANNYAKKSQAPQKQQLGFSGIPSEFAQKGAAALIATRKERTGIEYTARKSAANIQAEVRELVEKAEEKIERVDPFGETEQMLNLRGASAMVERQLRG